jgi:hypothetical protein
MKCIFCLEERESSLEHVFPDAIGGTWTTDRVCKPCNDWLGSNVDGELTDHPGMLMKRFLLGIKNRDGSMPPFERIFRGGVLANDREQRVTLQLDKKTGELVPKIIHQSTRTTLEDGREVIEVKVDASQAGELEKIIKRTRKREGLPPLSEEQLTAAVEAAKNNMVSVEKPEVFHQLKIDFKSFRPAILKIIYEAAFIWLGDAYLEDPIAAVLRKAILEKTEDGVKGQLMFGDVPPFDKLFKDSPNSLIALSTRAGPAIVVAARILDLMSGLIVVTEHPNRYPQTAADCFTSAIPRPAPHASVVM